MFAYAGLAALIAGFALVRADVVPTAPGPGDVFTEGGKCTFTWTPDTTGTWKEMNVELMTGSNTGMVHLTSAFAVRVCTGRMLMLMLGTYSCHDPRWHGLRYDLVQL